MRSTVYHALTKDPSKALSSPGSQHQKGHIILYFAITFSELLIAICLASVCAFLIGIPKDLALPHPPSESSFSFIYLPCTQKNDSVQQHNKGVSLNTKQIETYKLLIS